MRFSGTCVLASRLLNEPDRDILNEPCRARDELLRLLVLPKLLLLLSSRL